MACRLIDAQPLSGPNLDHVIMALYLLHVYVFLTVDAPYVSCPLLGENMLITLTL